MKRIPVLVDINQRLQRDLISEVLKQLPHVKLVEFKPDGEARTVEKTLRRYLKQSKYYERVVVITSVEGRRAEEKAIALSEDWLMTFPELFVIAISWSQQQIYTLKNEMRCECIANSLKALRTTVESLTD